MKKNYGFDTEFNKLRVIACSLWMGFKRGEGELEIEDQGRLQKSRFSQETEAIGQQTPRIGEDRPKLRLAPNTQVFTRVSSAGRTLNSSSTPQFFSSSASKGETSPASKKISFEVSPVEETSTSEAIRFSLENEKRLLSEEQKPVFIIKEKKSAHEHEKPTFVLDENDYFFTDEAEQVHKERMNVLFEKTTANTQNSLQDILKAAADDEDSAV